MEQGRIAVMDPVMGESTDRKTDKALGWKVILWNDEYNSFQHVEYVLQRVVRMSLEKAQETAIKIDKEGRAVVYEGHKERVEAVCFELQREGLNATISQ